jgi:hypothetical protein
MNFNRIISILCVIVQFKTVYMIKQVCYVIHGIFEKCMSIIRCMDHIEALNTQF